MSNRTYIRTLFNDIFRNNVIVKVFSKIVNFYCNLWFNHTNSIKFQSNMSITNVEEKRNIFFQSVTGDKIDCK